MFSMRKDAPYQIASAVNDGFVEMTLTGEITNSSTENLMQDLIASDKLLEKRKQLIDFRQLRGRLGITDTYHFVRRYPVCQPAMKIAFVDTPDNVEMASFQEATALNAGLRFKWFTDIDSARIWLKNK